MIDRQQLIDLVKKEAQALIVHATKRERAVLSFERLDPLSENLCVYGQMTGDCFGDRANYLIDTCAPIVYSAGTNGSALQSATLNGRPNGQRKIRIGLLMSEIKYFSPIEVFIATKNKNQQAQSAALIAFLREETSTLDIS